ncbi:MAG TPA: ABC transporter substrate-binding protein, partial [Aggregatilineaceae bacterium]|nr:ABC transporter substrate-binding protein [Aggregatilineaceae bacterium]
MFERESRDPIPVGHLACAGVLIPALIVLVGVPAYAQSDDFPRTVIDATGAPVTIPALPSAVAVIGTDPVLEQVVSSSDLRQIDPTAAPTEITWAGIGLLVVPDLYAAAYPALVASARAAGVPVFRTTLITGLPGWRASIERFGRATGREDRASAAIRWLDLRLKIVHAAVHGQAHVRVLVLTPEGYTFGRRTLITDLLDAAGGINAAAEAGFDDFRQIDDAAIRTLATDVILLSPTWSDAGHAAFLANPAYTDIPAVRAGRVFRLRFRPTLPRDPGAAVVALAILLHVTVVP